MSILQKSLINDELNIVQPLTAVKDRSRFIVLVSIFAVMLLTRDVLQINIPTIILTLYAVCAYLFFDYNECIAFSLMCIAFGSGIAVNYTLGAGLIIMLLKQREVQLTVKCIPAVLLIMYELLHFIVLPFDFPDYLRYAICMSMMILIVYKFNADYDHVFIIKSYAYSVLFIVIDIFLQSLRYYNFSVSSLLKSGLRFGNVASFEHITDVFTSNNQNVIAFLCIVAVAALIVVIFSQEQQRKSLLMLTSAITIFGILTASRTYMLALLFIAIYLFYVFWRDSRQSFFKNFCMISAVALLVFLVVYTVSPTTFEFIFNRFGEEETFGKRDTIFSVYNQYMFADIFRLIFGIGRQTIAIKTGFYYEPHNSTQEAFVAWGILGLIIVFFMLKNIVSNAKRQIGMVKVPAVYYLPFFTVVLFSQTVQLYGMNEQMLLFAVSFCAICLAKNNRNKGEKRKVNAI